VQPKKPSVVKKIRQSSYLAEEAFLATIEPYKLNKKEKYMSAKQKKTFSKNFRKMETNASIRTN